MSKNKRKLYCAYGSNLCIEQMNRRCPTAKVVGSGMVEGYKLKFRGGFGSAVATIEPTKDNINVPVLIWSITEKDEDSLDSYEGWPTLYRKENIIVTMNSGELIEVMAYIMNPRYDENAPSLYYYNIIKDGYQSAGFDINYLRRAAIRSSNRRVREAE
ncbi:MAG: gamma-glutamylcyclotransferase family protein [Eubacteriales bacterium]